MPPESFGPYRVVRLLGRGGMGSVYEGIDPATSQRVAIKTLAVHLSDDEGVRRRFQSEIDVLLSLRHPGIAGLLAWGEENGVPFFSMEFVPGRTLEQVLRSGGRFSLKDTAAVAVEVLRVLKVAHDTGVVHRDLKPANLMFHEMPGGKFRVKVTDFGIAKLYGEGGHTRAGLVIGTPEYMAPEQAAGRAIDHRADLYCLGLVMHAMVAGHPPFTGGAVISLLDRQQNEEPPRLDAVVADVPVGFADLVARLLAKSPSDRPANATAVQRALEGIVATIDSSRGTKPEASSPKTPPASGNDPSVVASAPTVAGGSRSSDRRAREVATTLAMDHGHRLADAPQRDGSSSFVTVDAVERRRSSERKTKAMIQTVFGAMACLAVVGVVGGAVWYVVPGMIWVPPEQQYDRIIASLENPSSLDFPCPLIATFLAAHPTHAKAEELAMIGHELALEMLEKRSRRRMPTYKPTSEAERLYLEALHSVRGAPRDALDRLKTIKDLPSGDGEADGVLTDPCGAVGHPTVHMWKELAGRLIKVVEPLAAKDRQDEREAKANEREIAADMVANAKTLLEQSDRLTGVERVMAVVRSHDLLKTVKDEYKDLEHCRESVAEAESLLEKFR